LDNPPCSAACYTAITSGATYSSTDGIGNGSISATNIFDSLSSAGLSWTEFCESSCGRGPDHSPCLQYADTANSPNCVTLSGALIGNSQVLGSTSNYVWITPTDGHNMHDTASPAVTASKPHSTLTFLYIGHAAAAAVRLTVILVKYHSRNRRPSATLKKGRQNQSRTDSA